MIGKTNSQTGGGAIKGEKLNISLTSNQVSHSDLIGAIITVTHPGGSTEHVWEGSEITVSIPPYVEYSVEYGEVAGYAAPVKFTSTAVADNSRTLTATYNTTVITASIKSNQSTTADLANATVTVGGKALKNGESAKFPTGTQVSAVFSDVSGYKTPAQQTITPANASMTVSGTYQTAVLTVTHTTNQSSHNDVATIKTSVKGTTVNASLTNGQSVKIPFGEAVTITPEAVSGYTTPAAVSYTAGDVSKNVTLVYNTTIVTVVMSDNQTTLNDIANATATVSASGITTTTVKTGQAVKVPTGASCTVVWNELADYKAPQAQTFNTNGPSETRTGIYQTEIVSVTLSADNGASLNGATVNINGILHTWNGIAITQKVAFGTTYSVSVGKLDGFSAPSAQNNITASQASRSLSFTYNSAVLRVNILSNQGADATISAVKAIVSYGDTSLEVANGQAVEVPVNSEVTIEYPDVEGYKTPDSVTFTYNGGVIEKTGTYQCELLTVNVAADEGSVSGYEITISKKEAIGSSEQYTKLEYIEANGSQWVDTGFTPNNNSRMVLDFESTKSGTTNNIIGTRSSTSSKVFAFSTVSGYWRVGYNNASTQTSTGEDMLRHVLDFNKNYILLDGTQLSMPTSATFTGYGSIYIGAIHATSKYVGYVKIYDCKIYDNGILVRDFTPALREDGIAGLYDSVNDAFYASAGTSNFVAGPEATYERIEYIKSTGTQYINTGFKPNQDTRVVIDCIVNIPSVSMDSHAGVICAIDSNGKTFGLGYDNGMNASEGKCIFSYNTSKNELKDNYESLGTRYVFDINKNKLLRNGIEILTASSASFQCDAPLYLSGLNDKGVTSPGNTTSLELYSCQIYDNEVLVRDFVPALRSDGTAGLYDKVHNRFYTSASGLNFEAGGNLIPMHTQTSVTGTYKIPFNTSYTISASDMDNYKTPSSVTRIAKDKSHLVTMEYKIKKVIDLSLQDVYGNPIQQSTANCYVIKEPGQYKFPLVYGNAIKNGKVNYTAFTNNGGAYSHDFVNSIGEVITQPYIYPSGGNTVSVVNSDCDDNVISDVLLDRPNAYMSFTINQVPQEGGNIILQLKGNANGGYENWSWHIWLWPHDLTPVEITNATGVKYNIMPVNIASKYDADGVHIKNWFFQWGRHTPMLLPSAWNSTTDHTPGSITKTSKASNLTIGLINPSTFYYNSTSPYNWFGDKGYYNLWDASCTGTGNSDNDTVKTVYDPCPVGWKIPNGNTFTGFNIINTSDSIIKFTRYSGDSIGVGFPMSGCRVHSNGSLVNDGPFGYAWLSSTGNLYYVNCLYFESGYMENQSATYRGIGLSVRPVEDDMTEVWSFSFTIKQASTTKTYYAAENMTWAEWCASGFNIEGWYINEYGLVLTSTGQFCIIDANNRVVSSTDVITAQAYNIETA